MSFVNIMFISFALAGKLQRICAQRWIADKKIEYAGNAVVGSSDGMHPCHLIILSLVHTCAACSLARLVPSSS